METHLEQYLYQPQKLLEDLRATDAQQFHTAMKCLLEDKWGHLVRRTGNPPPRGVGGVVDICWASFDSFLFSLSPPSLDTRTWLFFFSFSIVSTLMHTKDTKGLLTL